ncbi:regulatory protein RecX [Polluticoccus soli]|uniref:regulatory protein RecX n=1 Tax=Polluticoccus soli TaxID=3034150 RepID=UPI0023E2B643|nr:regulatory protein RecX [Flavipsychrobacter sp. JY13-12]
MDILASITHYCKYQERCHSEVRDKLFELGCRGAEVDERIADMIAGGFLNEERYARAYARGKFRMKQWGRVKITQQLRLKKVSDYCIKKGLTEIDAEEYENVIVKVLDKKLTELKSEKNIVARKGKMYRYAIQKGYESEISLSIINEMIRRPK